MDLPLEFIQSDTQRNLVAAFAEFAQSALAFDVENADEKCLFPQQQWQQCADYGLFRWIVPESLGGSGYSITTITYLLEELGYSCPDNGFAFAVAAQIWAVQKTLLQFATDRQIDRYLLTQSLSLIHI